MTKKRSRHVPLLFILAGAALVFSAVSLATASVEIATTVIEPVVAGALVLAVGIR